jgi:hypothetical protein
MGRRLNRIEIGELFIEDGVSVLVWNVRIG